MSDTLRWLLDWLIVALVLGAGTFLAAMFFFASHWREWPIDTDEHGEPTAIEPDEEDDGEAA